MASYTVEAVLKARDSGFSSAFKSAESRVAGLTKMTEKTGGLFKSVLGANIIGSGITRGIGAITSGVGGMISELNSSQKAWTTFEGNLRTFGHSEKYIQSAKKSMQDYAAQTIYSASEMASTYAQLDAVGVKNAGNIVKAMGGIASSAENPTQAMKSLSMQMTQMVAKPKVQWQDFRIMMEQAPAGMSAVAKAMGMSMEELVSKVQAGEISTKEFMDALEKAGNSTSLQKMATQYKSVDEAIQGTAEGLMNKMGPAFDVLNKKGIEAISAIGAQLDKINFDGFAKSLDSALSGIDFNAIMGKVASFVGLVSSKVADLWNGFKNTGAINDLGKAFDSIGGAISHVIESIDFGTIGSEIGIVAKAIAGIAKAGADFISALPPGVINAVVQGLVALAATNSGLKGVSGAMTAISKVKGAFDFGTKVWDVSRALVGVAKGAPAAQSALSFLTGGGALTSGLSAIASSIGGVLTSIGALVGGGLAVGAAIVAGIAIAVGALVWFFGFTDTGKKIWGAFVDWLAGIWSAVVDGAKAAWDGFVELMQPIVDGIKQVWNSLVEFWTTLWAQFQPIFAAAWNVILPIVQTVWNAILLVIQTVWTVISTYLTTAFTILTTIWTTVWNNIMIVVQTIWTIISTVIQTALAVISGIIQLATALITGNWSAAWLAIQGIFSAVWNGIKGVVTAVLNAVKGVIKNTLNAAKSIVNSVLNGIKGVFSSVFNAIKGVVSAAGNGIKTTFTNAINAMKNGVQNIINGVKRIFDGLKNINLASAGRAIINGFLNGLKSAFENVKNFVGGIASWIKENKGPISYDKVLLIPAGISIMKGFLGGLETGFKAVKKSVVGYAPTIAKMFKDTPIEFGIKTVISGAKETVSGLNDFVNNALDRPLSYQFEGVDYKDVDLSYQRDGQEELRTLRSAINALTEIAGRDVVVSIDGHEIARAAGQDIEEYNAQQTRLRNRLRGEL